MKKGWRNESGRHSLAARGLKTRHPRKMARKRDTSVSVHDKKIKMVEGWLKGMVSRLEDRVKELEEENNLEAILLDSGYMDTEIRIGDIKSPTKYEDVMTSPEWDDMAQDISHEVDVTENEAQDMLEGGAFLDLQDDIRVLSAKEIALMYIADTGFHKDEE